MVKTTKRSRKFVARSGGAAKANLAKKNKAKRGGNKDGGKKGDGSDKGGAGDDHHGREKEKEREEEERRSSDFLAADELGRLDVDSFFEKAAGGLAAADDEDDSAGEGGEDDGDEDDDDDGSVDSYGSLGSEEEDVEASEKAMKAALQKMASDDPDFHDYLKENESSLLEFGDDGDGDEMEDDDDEEEEEDDGEKSEAKKASGKDAKKIKQTAAAEDKFLLTPMRLQQLEQGAFQSHSLRGLKRIIAAYGTACHLSDASGQQEGGDSDDEEGGGRRKKKEFKITSPVVFDRLMAVCLTQCHEEFHYHLLGEGSGLKDDRDKKEEEEEESSSGSESDSNSDSSNEEDGKKDKKKGNAKKVEKSPTSLDENKPLHPKKLSQSPKYSALRPLLESFLKSTHHLLAEGGKEARLLRFVLSSLSKYVPYLAAFPKTAKQALKTSVRLWSAPLDTSEEYNAVRLQAFLRVRQLAVTQPYPFVEEALKLTYLSYAKRSKFGTAANVASVLPTLTFMGNCIVELYALDYASAYQHAFVYVRQLALHLRNALMKKTEESRKAVLCWQYLHCLKLWAAVLCAACGRGGAGGGAPPGGAGKDEEANLMRSLVYPLTEVILGTCRLVPSALYVPLRLHCVRLLQQLAASTETFIPTTSVLLGVLDLKEVTMKPLHGGGGKKGKGGKGKSSSGTVRGLRLPLILKLPKEGTLRTTEQVDGVLRETFVLLNREADLYRYSPGFPEFAYAIAQRLRKFNKEIKNGQWRAYSKGTVELCEKYSSFAVDARSTLVDAPKDVRRLEALKPAGVPGMGDRYDAAAAKERRLEEATRPATKRKADDVPREKGAEEKEGTKGGRKRKGGEEDDDDDESDTEEGEARKKSTPKKKKKKAAVVNEADLKNVEALEEEDEVQEGLDWSDDE